MVRIKRKKIPTSQKPMNLYKRGNIYKAIFLTAYIIGLLVMNTNIAFAGNLFDNASQLLNDVYLKFVGMSTAAAGVGVGTGVFMKKLSLGKQDKIELGNKVVKDSIIGWITLNALGIILNWASTYTK